MPSSSGAPIVSPQIVWKDADHYWQESSGFPLPELAVAPNGEIVQVLHSTLWTVTGERRAAVRVMRQ